MPAGNNAGGRRAAGGSGAKKERTFMGMTKAEIKAWEKRRGRKMTAIDMLNAGGFLGKAKKGQTEEDLNRWKYTGWTTPPNATKGRG